jgi:two-component system sensor histidine kinase KdpD
VSFDTSRTRRGFASAALTGGEALAAVALATGAVGALEQIAPATGLSVLYLLAVLWIAIRHGELPALGTAVVGVLALNYFFIEPRHRLTISSSENVVALAVLMIAAVVVGRLAATSRQRAAEAETRARLATAREREAAMLASAASAVLAGSGIDAQLRAIGDAVAAATGAAGARFELAHAPTQRAGEIAIPLPLQARPGWLYFSPDVAWQRADLERVAEPLARLLDVALERERIGESAAETEAARRAEVAKTAVLHAISHDLRTPLTAITTAAAALTSGGLSADDRTDLVSVLDTESARLARLVDDLLDLSRIEAGAANPQTDWCDLHDIVASAAAQVRATRGEHPIEFALPPDLPLVQADPAQLERVFSNLLENAIRFSPEDQPVRVSGGVGGGFATVRITDRGRGIAPSDRPHVFEPFFRGSASRGSGLGLAICRGFIEANNGRILLQSADGEETSFAVSFPLVAQPATTL